jgi:outer membrane protein
VLKRTLTAIALLTLALGLGAGFPDPAYAMKQKGDLLVRVRAVHFDPVANGTTDAGGDAWVNHDNVPELDFTYFFTDNIAAELILATTRHKVNVQGVADLGKVSLIPPVLTLQYHFNPKGKFSPYAGAGINYVIFYDEDHPGLGSVDYKDSLGWALQVGLDYAIDDRWSINFDVKKVFVDTDIKVNGPAVTGKGIDLDPWVFGLGVGYRF